MAIYICVQMGSACALEKVSDVGVETVIYDDVVTDSYVAVLMHDVVVMMTYHDLRYVSLLTHELVEISILTCSNYEETFCFYLEMLNVQHEH